MFFKRITIFFLISQYKFLVKIVHFCVQIQNNLFILFFCLLYLFIYYVILIYYNHQFSIIKNRYFNYAKIYK